MRLQSFRSARAGAAERRKQIIAAGTARQADETDRMTCNPSCPGLSRASTFFLRTRCRQDVDGRERKQVYVVCARQTTMPGHDDGWSYVITCGSACRCPDW